MLTTLIRESVKIERLGRALEIQELSARAQREISKQHESDPALAAAMVAKFGVVEWCDETPEAILDAVGAKTLQDIGREVYRLTGVELAKNSEPAPSAGSSSG
jgi:hypothetical protein